MAGIRVAAWVAFLGIISVHRLSAQDAAATRILPPELPWTGASEDLVVDTGNPWMTPSERTGLTETPRYAVTVEWIEQLVAAAPQLQLVSIGKSAQGRDVWMVIASKEGSITPEELKDSGRPLLLAHAGIHSGEIDGKDAGLMLLRDMTVAGTKTALLDHASFLFIPILSVDAHERFSKFSRINQRGPREMGWRTNSRNLNLNRDFTKLQTEEVRALVNVINRYRPDLYLDLHVTDGADYQYDITYGSNGSHAWSPTIGSWLETRYREAIDSALTVMGHVPGPLLFAADGRQMTSGAFLWTADPRFSNGYGDARHLPTVLVENHSLKPYRQRVLGTYVLMEETLRLLGAEFADLREATSADLAMRRTTVPLSWTVPAPSDSGGPATMQLRGVRSELLDSPVTGKDYVVWTGERVDQEIPVFAMTGVSKTAVRPREYYVPAAWSDITGILETHGIQVRRIEVPTTVDAQMYRVPDASLEPQAFEGRARTQPGEMISEMRQMHLMPGAAVVSTDQELGDLAVLLLEPESPDSFFQWGFFLEVLQRTEYVEEYIMEPMARRMLDESPEMRVQFESRVSADSTFASSPRSRLQWFYEQTPFYDDTYALYPVGRSMD